MPQVSGVGELVGAYSEGLKLANGNPATLTRVEHRQACSFVARQKPMYEDFYNPWIFEQGTINLHLQSLGKDIMQIWSLFWISENLWLTMLMLLFKFELNPANVISNQTIID